MTIHLFFGEMGAGKSHLCKRLAADPWISDCKFIEGDNLIPAAMAERTKNFRPVSPEMISDLVLRLKAIEQLPNANVAVCQALYRNEHRIDLIKYWQTKGHEVKCYWVRTPFLQHLKQLWSRPRGARWILYWLMNKPWFQVPNHPHEVIWNER